MEIQNYCRVCLNRKMDPSFGIICGLTNTKKDLSTDCLDFSLDEQEKAALVAREKAIAEEEDHSFFSIEKKGIRKGMTGGIIMMAIAAAWFIIGYMAGYIFYYPPILFVIGAFAFVKGMISGNVNGNDQ